LANKKHFKSPVVVYVGSKLGDEDTTKGKDHEALEGPMTRGIHKKAQHSDDDTTKGKDHEAP